MKLLITLTLVLLFTIPVAAAEKYALLIGGTTYQHARMNDTELLFPEADATSVGELLSKSGYTVVTLVGKEATQKRIADELTKLSQQGTEQGVVLVGLFGHGVQHENDAYFGPYDTTLRIVTDSQGRELREDYGAPTGCAVAVVGVARGRRAVPGFHPTNGTPNWGFGCIK